MELVEYKSDNVILAKSQLTEQQAVAVLKVSPRSYLETDLIDKGLY